MNLMSSRLLVILLFCAGCASLAPEPDGDLGPFIGLWGSSSQQGAATFLSGLDVRPNGTVTLDTLVAGVTKVENKLSGTCRVKGKRLIVRFEKSEHPLDQALPVELDAYRENEGLAFHDNPRKRSETTLYQRVLKK